MMAKQADGSLPHPRWSDSPAGPGPAHRQKVFATLNRCSSIKPPSQVVATGEPGPGVRCKQRQPCA